MYAFSTPYNPTNSPIEDGVEYSINLSKYKENRSLEQNRLLWELIKRIAEAENGGRANEDDRILLYCNLLEGAGAVSVYMEIDPNDLEDFEKSKIFRAHRMIGYNQETNKLRVVGYIGSSKFNTKQMSDFIDYVLDYASNYEIYLDDVKELLK